MTLAEAASWLDPPVSERQLHALVTALPGIRPVPAGSVSMRGRGRGRPPARYQMAELIRLHAAVLPFLGDTSATPGGGCDR